MSIDLEAIRARAEMATPGKWQAIKSDDGDTSIFSINGRYIKLGDFEEKADADFIAHAPETIKALLAEVERQAAEIAAVTAERDALIEDFTDFACGGCANAAPYCANKSPECTDAHEWCIDEKCKGFRPSACGSGKEQKHG